MASDNEHLEKKEKRPGEKRPRICSVDSGVERYRHGDATTTTTTAAAEKEARKKKSLHKRVRVRSQQPPRSHCPPSYCVLPDGRRSLDSRFFLWAEQTFSGDYCVIFGPGLIVASRHCSVCNEDTTAVAASSSSTAAAIATAAAAAAESAASRVFSRCQNVDVRRGVLESPIVSDSSKNACKRVEMCLGVEPTTTFLYSTVEPPAAAGSTVSPFTQEREARSTAVEVGGGIAISFGGVRHLCRRQVQFLCELEECRRFSVETNSLATATAAAATVTVGLWSSPLPLPPLVERRNQRLEKLANAIVRRYALEAESRSASSWTTGGAKEATTINYVDSS